MLGRDPWTAREDLMRDVCFIADVAILPRGLRVAQVIDYVQGVHPRFDRAKAEGFLARTTIQRKSRVHELSKGMVTQLHLALIMAIDARLLVLDEPTLGLDLIYRKQFYDGLLNDYFDGDRTILISTHQVEEIQHILTDVIFLDQGRVVLDVSMEELEVRYLELVAGPDQAATARSLDPIYERQAFGRTHLVDRTRRLSPFGGETSPCPGRDEAGFVRQNLTTSVPRRGPRTAGLSGRGAHRQPGRHLRGRRRRSAAGARGMNETVLDSAPRTLSQRRLLYWSVRRELWEHRAVYLAPAVIAVVALIGTGLSALWLPRVLRRLDAYGATVTSDLMTPTPSSRSAC